MTLKYLRLNQLNIEHLFMSNTLIIKGLFCLEVFLSHGKNYLKSYKPGEPHP